MDEIQVIFVVYVLFPFCGVPIILTIINCINLFRSNPLWENGADLLTFLLGPLFMLLLWLVWSPLDWDQPLTLGADVPFHAPIASWHMPTVAALAVCAWVGYCLLRLNRHGKLPPLPTALCIGGLEIGMALSAVFLIQLSGILTLDALLSGGCLFMALFPLNYILCSLRLMRRTVTAQAARFREMPPQRPLPALCCRLLRRSQGWLLAGFLVALPLLALLLCVLVLLGQAPDAAVRGFTETSDWALSQKISPPPLDHQGHYLCTVAAGGHPRLVKPTRYGLRRGEQIVVNRQLCVANAFEQLLQERVPRFHRAVRGFYDAHGYPLSQKITTPLRADAIYLLMKPLEWFFLLVLYTFDHEPESRIATQYTGTAKVPV